MYFRIKTERTLAKSCEFRFPFFCSRVGDIPAAYFYYYFTFSPLDVLSMSHYALLSQYL